MTGRRTREIIFTSAVSHSRYEHEQAGGNLRGGGWKSYPIGTLHVFSFGELNVLTSLVNAMKAQDLE